MSKTAARIEELEWAQEHFYRKWEQVKIQSDAMQATLRAVVALVSEYEAGTNDASVLLLLSDIRRTIGDMTMDDVGLD